MDESYLEWLRVLPGFSAETARRVADRFPTLDRLRAATDEELASVEGLTPHDLEVLHTSLAALADAEDGRLSHLCPECGSFAGQGAIRCPFCGTALGDARDVAAMAQLDEFLRDDAAPPLLCQACGAVMDRSAAACRVCGRQYSPQEAALLPGIPTGLDAPTRFCPRCGAYLASESTECAICGQDRARVPPAAANGHNGKGLAEGFLTRWQRVAEVAPVTEMDRLKEELEEFDRILEADASLARVWAKRGRTLAKMGRAVDAAESLSKAAELDPTKDEAYRLEVLDILQAKGDMSFLPPRWRGPKATVAPAAPEPRLLDALNHYEALLDSNPGLVVAWRTKGEILERLGRADEARACFSRADILEHREGEALRAKVAGLQAPGLSTRTAALVGRTNGRPSGRRQGRSHGRTNGRVNGVDGGRVNGLTNGAVNGLEAAAGTMGGLGGLTNGRTNGLVNGNGFTNGRRGRYGPSRIPPQPHWARSLVGIAAVVALMVLVPVLASILSPTPGPYAPIAIDHNFSEWNRFTAYVNAPPATFNNPDINLLEVKVTTDPSNLYVYAKVQGLLFQAPWTNGTESILVFVDTDRNPNTGYPVGNLGADLLAVVTGWDGKIQSTGRYAFNESGVASSNDFRRFLPAGSVDAAFQGDQIELRIPMDTDPTVARILVYGADNQGNRDAMAGIIQPSRATIVVGQKTVAPAVVTNLTAPFLRVDLSAMGGVPTVSALSVRREGESAAPVNLSLYLDDGSGTFRTNETRLGSAPLLGPVTKIPLSVSLARPATLWAVATFATLTPTKTFGFQVEGAIGNGTSSLAPPDTTLVYLGAAPTALTVDGAFGDWAGRPYGASPLGNVVNRSGGNVYDANVDLLAVAVDRSVNLTGFAQVAGRMMGGEDIPNEIQRPAPSPPPSGNISNVTPPYSPDVGYDVLYAYIDADNSSLTGLPASVDGRSYGFDYAIAVTGRNGTVVSAALYAYAPTANSTWRFVEPAVAALDAHRIEFAANATAMNLSADYRVVFYATDWRLEYDVAFPDAMVHYFTLGTLAVATNVVLNEISTGSNPQWIEVANPTAQSVSIQGWTLNVQQGNRDTAVYTFGNVVLGPFGSSTYLLAVNLASGSLPSQRSTVSLEHGSTVVDQTTYPNNLGAGSSWARYKDPQTGQPMSSYNGGSAWYTSSQPTKGAANDQTGPLLTLTLSSSSRTAVPGSYLTYTVGYSNTGTAVAHAAWINDTLPAGVTFVSSSVPFTSVSGATYTWAFSDLSVGTHSITIRVQVNGMGNDGSSQVNKAMLAYTDQLGVSVGTGSAWSNVTVRRPQITVAKIVTPASAVPGQTVTFTIYYNNTGSRRASTVSILEVLPSGLIYQSSTPRPTAVSGRNYYWNFTNVGTGSHRITLIAVVAANAQGPQLVNWAYLNYTVNRYSLPGSKASAVVAIPELSDFLFVVAVPFLVIGMRRRSRRSKDAEKKGMSG